VTVSVKSVLVNSLASFDSFVTNRRHDGSILLLDDFDLMLVDSPQLNLIKCRMPCTADSWPPNFAVKSRCFSPEIATCTAPWRDVYGKFIWEIHIDCAEVSIQEPIGGLRHHHLKAAKTT